MAGCMSAVWLLAAIVFRVAPSEDQTAAMLLLFAVLLVSTLADRALAIVTSLAASLSFSYFFIDPVYTLSINTIKDAVSFGVFLMVALIASHLSIRARVRAEESERRRSEMERLQKLGSALAGTDTVTETAGKAVHEIVRLFGGGAIISINGPGAPFRAGSDGGYGGPPVVVRTFNDRAVLELYGEAPSVEVRSALVNLLGFVLDRAAAAEDRARIESAKRGEELRTTVLNALAHNFRTPLTCIKAAASMMRGSESIPGTYSQELVEVIDEEADRLDELIRDSLDLARIQSRQANPRLENCSVASIIASVTGKMKRYLASHKIVVDVAEGLPCLRGDRFLFEQMLTQVLDNAWKYAATGARIWISAEQKGEELILTIRNEGPQIPEDERGLIFDRFYRGARSRAGIEGTGLGLAIAKTIAEAHGGRIWLDTDPAGPTFRFAFPAGAPVEADNEEDHDREPNYITD